LLRRVEEGLRAMGGALYPSAAATALLAASAARPVLNGAGA